ncbi:cingulin-like protein 1 [Dorcoceras hygrometricum]|uniref:Cingulin-like protein 1 n=1 Tax=Dorcoceras hygrometricum TaxID=472368 RepID=A0A2Z7CMY0_9LAMI|nr:cingulin-like protein 1 [Dorcoceras hygrometricum]
MARKKVSKSHQQNPTLNQEHEDLVVSATMDSDASEKFENLKSLNQMLLKEAFERRQQVESLLQVKESLESELARSDSERELMRFELREMAEMFDLEKIVVAAFAAEQLAQKYELIEGKMKGLERETMELKEVIDEKETEIGSLYGKLTEAEAALGSEREVSSRVRSDRDEMKGKLDARIEECEGLIDRIVELEERKRELEVEMESLQVGYDGVLAKNKELEKKIEVLVTEKDLTKKNLSESNLLFEKLKKELQAVIKEKEGIEEEKYTEMVKTSQLEDHVRRLNEMVESLREEKEALCANVAELEMKCVKSEEKQNEMGRKIEKLLEEQKLGEKRFECLIGEKDAIERDLGDALKQLDDTREKIEDLVKENTVLVEAKDRLDIEISAFNNQVEELKVILLESEKSSGEKVEKITSIESQVVVYRDALERAAVERDEIKKCWDQEKQLAITLVGRISEMEKKVEENLKTARDEEAKLAALYADKIELENQCRILQEEITSLQNTLNAAQCELESVRGQVELAGANSELALNLLKETVVFCSKGGEKEAGNGDLHGGKLRNDKGTDAYVMELERIKNAFNSNETKMENLNMQLEFLQNSVATVQKKKSFWTMLSSATTVLAAVSLAYVARGH